MLYFSSFYTVEFLVLPPPSWQPGVKYGYGRKLKNAVAGVDSQLSEAKILSPAGLNLVLSRRCCPGPWALRK